MSAASEAIPERKIESRQFAFIQKKNRNNLSKVSVRILNYGSVLDPEESHKKQQLRTEIRFRQLHQETISEKDVYKRQECLLTGFSVWLYFCGDSADLKNGRKEFKVTAGKKL